MTRYVGLNELNERQKIVMAYVDWWVKNKNTPIPQQEIVKKMEEDGIKDYVTKKALKTLLKRGYLRKAYIISNKTFYVQLRRA